MASSTPCCRRLRVGAGAKLSVISATIDWVGGSRPAVRINENDLNHYRKNDDGRD
jgi:hypothetical protein